MHRLLAIPLVLFLGSLALATGDLSKPAAVLSDGAPIDVEVGHAAPLVTDWDGDGLPDLLVGQFGEGRLRIYRNVGSHKEPRFAGFEVFQAGGEDGKVPSG